MILKEYQETVIKQLKGFFELASEEREKAQKQGGDFWLSLLYDKIGKSNFIDKPKNGLGKQYPRFCMKVPTGGGKTFLAVKTICEYQENFAKRKTGLVVWITHRETIYQQTIKNLRDKNHFYRQALDQLTQNKTIIVEKGQAIRVDDLKDNLVVLMLMIQSANRQTRETMKIFRDNGGYIDFFPSENRSKEQKEILEKYPNLEKFEDALFGRNIIKTSLGNIIRASGAFFVIDEFHTMFSDLAKKTIDDLNPEMVLGLSATPRERAGMNVLVKITGKQLQAEQMIKIPLELVDPQRNESWKETINKVIKKRDELEKLAVGLKNKKGIYIRPIALIQAERAGRDQEQNVNFVHAEHVVKYLLEKKIDRSQIAIKTSEKNEIKDENLLSKQSEIRYIITREALKEGWDCSFAYVLGVIPNTRTESSMTQLIGRILRQPYAKYTEIEALNKSYVFYNNGESEEVMRNIWKGFEEEGLEDLAREVSRESGPSGSRKKVVKIKKHIKDKYSESLFLPVWTIKNEKRKFYYDVDIKQKINWQKIRTKTTKYLKNNVLNNLNKKPEDIKHLVDLGKKSETIYFKEESGEIDFDVFYLSKRIFEVSENGFIALELSKEIISQLEKMKDKRLASDRFGYIVSETVEKIENEKKKQEQEIFEKLVKDKILNLSVSTNMLGYKLPQKTEIYPEIYGTSYQKNLFEESSSASMDTTLEKDIAKMIDEKESVLWWVKNLARNKEWYFVRGWQKNKIYPDFIVAKKDNNEKLKLVYVFEAKGQQLFGNIDTIYKKAVFDKINAEKVEEIDILKFKMNQNFDFEFVEGGKEELEINKFL